MRRDMKSLLIAVFALLFVVAPAKAAASVEDTPSWVQQAAAIKVPAYDKDVAAVVLVNERITTVDSEGRINEVLNYAVRILQREGRGYAMGHVGYIPDSGKV